MCRHDLGHDDREAEPDQISDRTRRGSAAIVSSPLVAIARNIITIKSNKLRRSSQSFPTRIKKQAVVARSSV